jgi:hypothetical protein
MSFAHIESILGFPMPASARKYRPWWANQSDGGHVQAQAWMNAGWRVWSVQLSAERVEFQRVSPEQILGASETTTPFHHREPRDEATDLLTFDRAKLSITARRILDDYTAEASGDVQAALDRALHEARMAFRKRLIDGIERTGPPSPVSSVNLIREDRDAR